MKAIAVTMLLIAGILPGLNGPGGRRHRTRPPRIPSWAAPAAEPTPSPVPIFAPPPPRPAAELIDEFDNAVTAYRSTSETDNRAATTEDPHRLDQTYFEAMAEGRDPLAAFSNLVDGLFRPGGGTLSLDRRLRLIVRSVRGGDETLAADPRLAEISERLDRLPDSVRRDFKRHLDSLRGPIRRELTALVRDRRVSLSSVADYATLDEDSPWLLPFAIALGRGEIPEDLERVRASLASDRVGFLDVESLDGLTSEEWRGFLAAAIRMELISRPALRAEHARLVSTLKPTGATLSEADLIMAAGLNGPGVSLVSDLAVLLPRPGREKLAARIAAETNRRREPRGRFSDLHD